jgi:hypothetical protein
MVDFFMPTDLQVRKKEYATCRFQAIFLRMFYWRAVPTGVVLLTRIRKKHPATHGFIQECCQHATRICICGLPKFRDRFLFVFGTINLSRRDDQFTISVP